MLDKDSKLVLDSTLINFDNQYFKLYLPFFVLDFKKGRRAVLGIPLKNIKCCEGVLINIILL